LQGARDDAHAARIEREMWRFPIAAMSSAVLAVDAARFYRQLRDRGVTVRKTIDIIIGGFCIANGHALLHDDRDFDAMQRYLGLQVV
jgi:predicted nucleic acid-binding protein